jgi:hypothetical protein
MRELFYIIIVFYLVAGEPDILDKIETIIDNKYSEINDK